MSLADDSTPSNREPRPGSGPFAGIRVLDLTRNVAGPLATYQLGLLGAEVVRIEQPGQGDRMRYVGPSTKHNAEGLSTTFLSINAGKRSLALDLKSALGRETFKRLAARADVLVESNRPGVMARLGLGPADLQRVNARLVYCSITGFGQRGPLRDVPSYDQMMQAVSGLMSVNGTPDTGPLRVGFPIIDSNTAMTAAFAIAGALLERERTGVARVIDVALLDSTLSMMSPILGHVLIGDTDVRAVGNEPFTGSPFSGVFRTADGLLAIAGNTPEQCRALCGVLGAHDLLDNPWIREGGGVPRAEGSAEVRRRLSEIYLTRSATDWESALQAVSVPAAKVRNLREILSHPQLDAREFLAEVDDRVGGHPVRVPTSGFRLDGVPRRRLGPAPAHGIDSEAVLSDFGIDAATIAELRERRLIE